MTARRPLPRRLGVAGLVLLAIVPAAARAFDFEEVARRAQQLAAQPYRPEKVELPKDLQGIDYDHYRDIRFRPDRMLWRDSKLPFEIAFFHMGLYFDQPVRINEIDGNNVRQVRFDPSMFDYGSNRFDPQRMSGLGFAGFRVHYALNTPKYKDEVLVFLGASYFRALGKGQVYGISARGLAIDTGLASGEEFPRFVEFWLERPAASATELTVYALLDSRRASGAYRFVLRPGVETAVDIKERLFLRENVSRLGIAPLTTMYFFGENQPSKRDDYRPEVHDSDGLSIHSGTGEWIWRPLVNPKRLLVTSFALTNPVGFGLMQRDRDFKHYEDLEARYDLRPSAWVQPKGKWGPGRVELVEIPSPDETNDNIVAYWVPQSLPAPGQPLEFDYRMRWQGGAQTHPPGAWATQSRAGRSYATLARDEQQVIVDFTGPALEKLGPDAPVKAVVTAAANAEIAATNVYRNEATGDWRLAIRFKQRNAGEPVELRAFLRNGNDILSETWSHVIPPR